MKGHQHHGLWPNWARNYEPIGYRDNYIPRVAVIQPSIEFPHWALVTGLGLMAMIAFRGVR